jgi:hypothetical protein
MDSFYTVIRGDSLFGIAQRFYGDGNKSRSSPRRMESPIPTASSPGRSSSSRASQGRRLPPRARVWSRSSMTRS